MSEPASTPNLSLTGDTSSFGGRSVTKIQGRIPPGEFLVYYFLTRDHLRCDRSGHVLNGRNEAGVLFHSFPEAEAFAKAMARVGPHLGAGIYDSSWKVIAEYVNEGFIRQKAKANGPGRLLLVGIALLLSGCVFMWFEVRSQWGLIIGFLIGSRLIFSGAIKLATGLYKLKTVREKAS